MAKIEDAIADGVVGELDAGDTVAATTQSTFRAGAGPGTSTLNYGPGTAQTGAGIGAGVDKLFGRSPDESFGDVYRQKLAEREGALSDFREDHPVLSTVAEIGGAIPTAGVGAAAAAATRIPALARALVGGGVGGGIYGAGASVPGERAEGALLGAGLGAGLGVVGAGVGKAIAARSARRADNATIRDASSADELRAAADVQYKIADTAEGALPVSIVAPFLGRLATTLKREGADHILHPKLARALAVAAQNADRPMSLQQLQIMRRQLGAAGKSVDGDERRLSKIAVDQLDEFVESGSGELGGVLEQGRALWSRLKKSELIEDAIARARTRAQGVEAGLRNEFSKLYRNKKLMRGFTAEEKAAIFDVSAGTPTRNAARILGGLSLGVGQRRNALNALIAGGLGMSAGGPGGGMIGMAAPAVIGGISQKIAERGTMRAAELARALAAGPRTAARSPAPRVTVLDQFLRQGAQRRLQGPPQRQLPGPQ